VGQETYWALDDFDRDRILARLPTRARPEIMRFKGLGEMQPKTLYETTLDPQKRRLLRVDLSDALAADATIAELMGKDPAMRFQLIMDRAAEVQDLDV